MEARKLRNPSFLRRGGVRPRETAYLNMRMNLYLLILAHAGPGSVERLVRFFDVPGFRIGLHVDAKSEAAPFEAIAQRFDHVACIGPRVDHLWGDWTMMDVHLNAIRWVAGQADVSHLVVISADTEPLRSAEAIRDYFAARPGKSVVDGEPWRPTGRVHRHSHTYYSPVQRWLRRKGHERLQNWVARLLPRPEAKYRRFPADWQVMLGRGWYGIAREHWAALLDFCGSEQGAGARYFKGTLVPEEHAFHTYLHNAVPDEVEHVRIMYADYGPARPPVLDAAEITRLKAETDYLFARKVPLIP